MDFKIKSDFKPTGDQPEAIKQLVAGVSRGDDHQILLGVTGSGKTFTVANTIARLNKPTLILSHNKTLAAQLYSEFKHFFPDNAVEYFVSYYDYYQPEAYLPVTNTYIEKDLKINEEIETLRLSTTSSLLSGRKDVIVVSSVSCLYGIGNPEEFGSNTIEISVGDTPGRDTFLRKLVDALYSRNEVEFRRGNFRVKGDTVEIYLAYADYAFRIMFWGDEIEEIESFDPIDGNTIESVEEAKIFPANIWVTSNNNMHKVMEEVQQDMFTQVEYFKSIGKHQEAKRLEERVSFDLEMMKELGHCSGIENYSRYFDQRKPGTRPFCLLDYFPDDFLMVVDESHVTIPQIRAMYGGDHSRKTTLVEYGFRLPSAIDNRPLKFEEYENLVPQTIHMSATPADYELEASGGVVVEQIIRPTGLLDPPIDVRPSTNQIDDLLDEINTRVKKQERVLVTTLTKRMAEELDKYLAEVNVKSCYIHSDVSTFDRVEIIERLQSGEIDVLVGVNLLREGLDLPQVSLVAILDADKEGFLRSERSLTQTAGRAARNVNGQVIMYADKVTKSMQATIDETNRRRTKQIQYNEKHGITPTQIVKSQKSVFKERTYSTADEIKQSIAADPVIQYMSSDSLEKTIEATHKRMMQAAEAKDFLEAARLRDEMFALQELLKDK